MIRRFKDLSPAVTLHGSDYDSASVDWCSKHLPFASFHTNQLHPPLRFEDEQFDLVYAFSVFTHFPESLERLWLAELRRVIRGGYLIFTVQADAAVSILSTVERGKFDQGELVVRYETVAGSNLCAAFHPLAHIRQVTVDWEWVETFDSAVGQRFVVLRRPSH